MFYMPIKMTVDFKMFLQNQNHKAKEAVLAFEICRRSAFRPRDQLQMITGFSRSTIDTSFLWQLYAPVKNANIW